MFPSKMQIFMQFLDKIGCAAYKPDKGTELSSLQKAYISVSKILYHFLNVQISVPYIKGKKNIFLSFLYSYRLKVVP